MTPHVLKEIGASSQLLKMFELIRRIVQAMPDVRLKRQSRNNSSEPVSCHMLTRALAQFFPVAYRDGYFGGGWGHSWLKVKSEPFIIDPYPWCMVGGPVLILYDYRSPYFRQYHRAYVDLIEYPEFTEHVKRVTRAVQATIRKLGIANEMDAFRNERSVGAER